MTGLRPAPSVALLGGFAVAVALGVTACDGGGDETTTTTTTTAPTTTEPAIETFTDALVGVAVESAGEDAVREAVIVVDEEETVSTRIPIGDTREPVEAALTSRILIDDDTVWVTRSDEAATTLYRVGLEDAEGEEITTVPSTDAVIALSPDAVWLGAGNQLVRVDRSTGEIVGQLGPEQLGAGFEVVGVAFGSPRLWVASISGGLLTVDPASNAVTVEDALVASCTENPTTREEFEANAKNTVFDLEALPLAVAATTSTGCTPDPVVVLINPADGSRRSVALQPAAFQTLTVFALGNRAAVARAEANDLVEIDVEAALLTEQRQTLRDDTLAETCSSSAERVVCIGALDDVVVAEVGPVPLRFEQRPVRGVRGTVIGWAAG